MVETAVQWNTHRRIQWSAFCRVALGDTLAHWHPYTSNMRPKKIKADTKCVAVCLRAWLCFHYVTLTHTCNWLKPLQMATRSVVWHMNCGERACGWSTVCVSERALYTIAPIYKRIGRMKRQKNMPERARGDWTHHTFIDRAPRRHQQPRKNLSSDKTHYYLVEAHDVDFGERPNVGEDGYDWWRSHVATNINICCSEITMESVCERVLCVCERRFSWMCVSNLASKRSILTAAAPNEFGLACGVRIFTWFSFFVLDTLQSTIYILRFTLTVYVQCIPTLDRCAIVHVFAWMMNWLGTLIFLSRIVWRSCDPKLLPIRRFRCSFTRNTYLKNFDLFFLAQIWSMQSEWCANVLFPFFHQNSWPFVGQKLPTSERCLFYLFNNHNTNRIVRILFGLFESIAAELLVNVRRTSKRTAHRVHIRRKAHRTDVIQIALHSRLFTTRIALQTTPFSVRSKIAVQLFWSLTYLIFHASQISSVRIALAACVLVCVFVCADRHQPTTIRSPRDWLEFSADSVYPARKNGTII